MYTYKDLTGQRFERLQATWPVGIQGHHCYWQCFCDCGKSKVVSSNHLLGKLIKSCGCLRKDVTTARSTLHGKYGTSEHSSWRAAKNRCTYPSAINYSDYGGRGITVCSHWAENFDTFFADLGLKPEPKRKYSLDRIDNELGYLCPKCHPPNGNCRWATKETQVSNTRVKRIENFSDADILNEFLRRGLKIPTEQ